ncbi:MAG: pyrroline-5-carboxylate reductase [Candidatus Omnitrophota bacterium]
MTDTLNMGLIGCGNMGSALAANLSKKNIFGKICVFDKDKKRQDGLARGLGVVSAKSLEDLKLCSNVILIAVKPQDCEDVLTPLKDVSGSLIISIAAGVSLAYLEARLAGPKTRVLRAMPNLNALIAQSVTALAPGRNISPEDLGLAVEMFDAIGESVIVPEGLIDAVTAISGSGPAFVAYLMDEVKEDALEKTFLQEALSFGLERKAAAILARGTVLGTRKSLSLNFDRETLIKRVASKGGTTEAGLKVLESQPKTPMALSAAIRAAFQRARELGEDKG